VNPKTARVIYGRYIRTLNFQGLYVALRKMYVLATRPIPEVIHAADLTDKMHHSQLRQGLQPVASLGLVSPEAPTDGCHPIFLKKI